MFLLQLSISFRFIGFSNEKCVEIEDIMSKMQSIGDFNNQLIAFLPVHATHLSTCLQL